MRNFLIDTDTASDDAVAIMMALAEPSVRVLGLTTVAGNVGLAIWKRDFSGSSGLFSIVLKPASEAAVAALLDGLELFGLGYSWAGFESLAIPFDCT
jgi:cystathionine beta-lyase